MTESNATGVDPRYDPRFQRGYTAGGETDASGSAPRSARSSRRAASAQSPQLPQPSRLQRESLEELERQASERTARTRAPEPASPASEPRLPDDAEPTPPESTVDLAPGHPEDPQADPAAGAPDSLFETGPSGARWFWIAIGMCVGFIVVGGIVFWMQASDPGIYSGTTRPGIDETTRMFLSAVSPALVQAGIIGAVAVLVVWAARNTRSGGGAR